MFSFPLISIETTLLASNEYLEFYTMYVYNPSPLIDYPIFLLDYPNLIIPKIEYRAVEPR